MSVLELTPPQRFLEMYFVCGGRNLGVGNTNKSLLKPGENHEKIWAEIDPVDGCGQEDDSNSVSGNLLRADQLTMTQQSSWTRHRHIEVAIRIANLASRETWQQM